MDSRVGRDATLEGLDDLFQFRGVPVLQQQVEERMGRLLLQVGERCRVGREAGLVGASLRHPEFFEENLLQLFGRTEVDLVTDFAIGAGREAVCALGQRGVQPRQDRGIDGDPGDLHEREYRDKRKFDLVEDAARPGVEPLGQVVGESKYIPGLGRGAHRFDVGYELVRVGLGQGLTEVGVDLRGKTLVVATRFQQPRCEGGVEGDAVEVEPGATQPLQLALGVVEVFRRSAGEPGLERGIVWPPRRPRHECRVGVGGEPKAGDLVAGEFDPEAERFRALRRGGLDPLGELLVDHGAYRRQFCAAENRVGWHVADIAAFGRGNLQNAFEQRAELQFVEDLANGGSIDGLAFEIGRPER